MFQINEPFYTPPYYVKVASRPKLDVDVTELHFLNAVSYIPGKGKWQPITITWRDVAKSDMAGIWNWIATVYNFQQPNNLPQAEKKDWNGSATLRLYDGCGSVLETWTLSSMWPQSVDWGDLDYSSSEEVTMAVTFQYSQVKYTGSCGSPTPSGRCSGC